MGEYTDLIRIDIADCTEIPAIECLLGFETKWQLLIHASVSAWTSL